MSDKEPDVTPDHERADEQPRALGPDDAAASEELIVDDFADDEDFTYDDEVTTEETEALARAEAEEFAAGDIVDPPAELAEATDSDADTGAVDADEADALAADVADVAEADEDADAAPVAPVKRRTAPAPVRKSAPTRRRAEAEREVKASHEQRTTPVTFAKESVGELRKVVWPTGDQLRQYFIVVLIFVLFIIAYVGVLDLFFGWGLLKLFG